MSEQIRVIFIAAHPDDCEIHAGGMAAMYAAAGHVVKFVSLTNGGTGHFQMGGGELARRRYAEAQAAADIIGITYDIVDNHTGELEPNVANRKTVVRMIRDFTPDIVLLLSPDDYHPDHRYASVLVQDSAYLVTVPGMCPLTPHLMQNPVYAYANGSVTTSTTFDPTLVFDIDGAIEKKLDMACCHESQYLEWIPYNQGCLDQVPEDKAEAREWMRERFSARWHRFADRWRDRLVARYGEERGAAVQYAEAIEICPFGSQPDQDELNHLFPFE